MIQTLEAVIHPDGSVKLMQPINLPASRRALLTVLEEEPRVEEPDNEAALLSEAALATDWNRSEEDAAWAHLQPAKLS